MENDKGAKGAEPNPPAGPAISYFTRRTNAALTARTLAFIGCRLLALYVAYQVITYTSHAIAAFVSLANGVGVGGRNVSEALVILSPLVLMTGLGVILWWKADWLADRAANDPTNPVDDHDEAESNESMAPDHNESLKGLMRPEDSPWIGIGLILMGTFVIAEAAPTLLQLLLNAINDSPKTFADHFSTAYWRNQLLAALFKCGLGIWMVFGTRAIAQFIRRMRHTNREYDRAAESE